MSNDMRIKELEVDRGLVELALEGKSNLLESCEKALSERDQQITDGRR